MREMRTIFSVHIRSIRNALRHETQMRIAWSIALIFGLISALWSTNWLTHQVVDWRAAGSHVLETHLWQLLSSSWVGLGILTVFATLREGFNNDEAVLLLTLPIPASVRFRILSMQVLCGGIGTLSLLFTAVMTLSLGWEALSWLIVAMLGVGVVAMCCMVGTLLVIRYILPQSKLVQTATWLGGIGLGLIVIAILTGWIAVPLYGSPPPELISVLFALLLVVVAGPCSDRFGRLYAAAFYTVQGRVGQRKPITPPGVRMLSTFFKRYRSVTGAMMVKELLYQSRNPLNWGRVIVVFVYLLPFPWIYSLVTSYGIPRMLFMVGYLSLVTLLSLIDAVPSPIGSEGNRLTLYLTAPLDLADILRAKLVVFLVPLLVEGLVLSIVLGWWLRVAISDVLFVTVQVTLITIGTTALLILGSAWDEDLKVAVEGFTQALLHEQLPSTARRIWLINLSISLLLVMLLLIWKLPVQLALPALAFVDGAVLIGAWHCSRRYLRYLLKTG